MKFTKFEYLIKEGFRNVWVNRLMSIASVGVLFSCLLLIGVSIVLSLNVDKGLKTVEEYNVALVWLDDLTPDQIKTVENQIVKIPNVRSCEFVAKSEWLKNTLDYIGAKDASVWESLKNDNPMPDGFRVSVKDLSLYSQTVSQISKITGVIEIGDQDEVANHLTVIRQGVTYAGLALIAMLFLISLFIISNTIKITMHGRKLEINIMKAVGATDWFVRIPFIIEGMILGTLSGILTISVIYYIYKLVREHYYIGFDYVPFRSFAPWLAIGFVSIGILAGVFGSVLTIRKYLKREGSEFNAI